MSFDFVTPADFGALGDGATDDTAALQAMFGTGLPVRIPSGVFIASAPLTVPTVDAVIVGMGGGRSEIRWTQPGGGLTFNGGNAYQSTANEFRMADLLLSTTIQGGGNAVSISYTGGGGTVRRLVTVERVAIKGVGLNAFWSGGFDADNCRNSVFAYCEVVGSSNSQQGMDFAFRLSDDNNQKPVDTHVVGNTVAFQKRAVDAGSDGAGSFEGLVVERNTMIANDYGVYFHAANNPPGLAVRGNHIASNAGCVRQRGGCQYDIADNLLYTRDSNSQAFIGIDVAKVSSAALTHGVIHHNTIRCNKAKSPTHKGIVADGKTVLVGENMIFDADVGIEIASSAVGMKLPHNIITGAGIDYVDNGTGTVIQPI